MKASDEADLIERIAEALSIQQRPTRAWSECSPITQSYWRASARAVLPILTDFAEALTTWRHSWQSATGPTTTPTRRPPHDR